LPRAKRSTPRIPTSTPPRCCYISSLARGLWKRRRGPMSAAGSGSSTGDCSVPRWS